MTGKLKLFLQETKDEFRKVNWPTRGETVRLTLVVIGISIGVAIILGLFDIFFTYLLQKFILRS